jgi:phytoene dehydrogenase-like protein
MAEEYDIVVGGGGSNGLVAAAYLAKAGLNVCVLECQNFLGSGLRCIKDVPSPGFIHDPYATGHAAIQFNPLIVNDELKLQAKYGLRYVAGKNPLSMIFPHKDMVLTIHKSIDDTCQEIAKISEKDAVAYREFSDFLKPMAGMLAQGMFSTPAPFGSMMSMLESAGGLGLELMRMMLMSAWDIVAERFESDELRILMTRFASEMMISPFEAGTGASAILVFELLHGVGIPFAEGGSEKLALALARCIEDHGGTIRMNMKVKSVKIENGRAKAFVLEDGEEVVGKKGLLSTFHVKQLFGENGMVDQKLLPPGFATKVKRIRPSTFSAINQNFALNEAPKFKAFGGKAQDAVIIWVSGDVASYKKLFQDLANGLPGPPEPAAFVQTLVDPTRAPAGKHTLYLYGFAPYDIYGDAKKWDAVREKVADDILEKFRSVSTNMGDDNILGRLIHTPLDIERVCPSFLQGDFCHMSQSLDQNLANRPIVGWGRYKTPIEGLYMGGASTSPGPTITGGGRAQCQVIFQDLGIDFDDVVSR